METKPMVDMVNPFVKVMQNKVPEYKRICSLLSIKRPYSSKYSKDIFPRFIRYFINSKCSKISMEEYDNLISNKYISEIRAKKCDHSIKVLLDSTHLTFPAIMIALGYISNLKKNTITSSLLHHQNNSEVKILTLALMASMKAHYDNVYSNKSWSTVSGIPLRELNIIESNFLRDINFDLFINEKIFFDYMDRVENSLSEYYKVISDKKDKNEIKINTETFENSNIPNKEIKDTESFKRNSVNLTPDASPRYNNESKYETKISESKNKSYSFLNVPENNYKSRKSMSNSPSDSNCKSPIYQHIISTPSIYSTETSFSSEFSELSLPQNKNNNRDDNENSFQIYHNKNYDESNKQQNACQSFDNNNETNNKDSKQIKNRFNFLNQSNNNNDIKYSKSLGFYNTNKSSNIEESTVNKSKSRKYLSSSIPNFLYKYQQKVENGEYIKYLDDLDSNAKEIDNKISEVNYFTNNEKLHSSPIQNSKIEIVHSSPVPIKRNFTYKQYSKDKRYNKNDNDQHEIPKRTSSNDLHKLLPKRASSTNLNAQYKESYSEYIGSGIKHSKSISITYQTKPNQQIVDSSNQLFRHKTVSLTTTVATSSVYANYPQGQFAIPVYQQQVASVQQVIPYYIPQNSSQIGVILDTNMVQQPIPIPPNSTILQAQPMPPNPIPSPISPQSIVYSNGITIRHQNSFQSNYSTPSPYIGSVISTPINTNVYYPAENNLTTPVHIISPPPIMNPITNYTYNTSSQDNSDYNSYSKSKEKLSDNNNFDRLSRKSYTSITDNSSYDSLYYHDIVDSNSINNEHDNSTSSIAKRSNTIGGYQNIRSELSNKGNVPNQYLHPNSSTYSYTTSNNNYGYDNSISRSNSYNSENNIVRVNTYSHETNININTRHSYSYDNNLRKSTPSDIYRNNSYDSTASISNSGYYEPSISYSYVSSSLPVINGTYRSNSYASSTSSMINDTGSYYSNNSKRQSNTSSYYKKKQNNKYSTEYQYLNEDKSKPFYRSKSVNNKNYKSNNNNDNNNNNNKSINRSRSYSNSYRFKNNYNKYSNNNGFNNSMKDKSKLNNISTLNASEDISTHKNKTKFTKYNNNENKELNKKINNINVKNTENIENDQESNINLSNSSSKKDYEVKSKAESETYVASIKTNRDSTIDKHNETDQKSETIEVELYSNSGISNSSLINDYINESSYSLQSNTSKKETSKSVIVDEIKNHYKNELKNDDDDVNDKTDVNESSDNENEDEVNAIFSNYNTKMNSNKISTDCESRRYSSISTYILDSLEKDSPNYLMKNNKYRYSDCNFDSFEYDSSFHIENIKNELMDNNNNNNNKYIDTITLNSNITDTDFISEGGSLKNTEEDNNSYISSIIESNDDENTDSNINLYINHEDIGSIKSYVSSMNDYYDPKSENSKNEIVNNINNISYSSKTSSLIDNHTLLDKVPRSTNANMIKFGLKKAFRTNSTPIYSNTNNHISEEKRWNNNNNSSNQEIMDKYKNLSENKSMDKDTSIVNERQEPKIIKIHTSKRSGIKKTMSLILESSSKIFTKKQNQQNQNQSQSKGINVNIPYYANKELPPIPSNKDLLESAKEELKLTKKKHHSFTQPTSIGSHLLLKLDRDASFAASSSFSKPGSIHYVEPTSISDSNDESNK